MAEPVFMSALAGLAAAPGLWIAIREVTDRGMIDLRGDPKDAAFREAVEAVLGVPLPTTPRTSSPSPQGGGERNAIPAGAAAHSPSSSMEEGRGGAEAAGIAVLWLSLDQWLVTCPRAEAPRLAAALKEALGSVHSLVVDLSDARAILRLEGEGVREVLMKGAPVDLTLPEFTLGTVRRLRFGEIAALIHITGERPDVIDLYVFRSYARFAWDWIAATAKTPAKLRLFGRQEISG